MRTQYSWRPHHQNLWRTRRAWSLGFSDGPCIAAAFCPRTFLPALTTLTQVHGPGKKKANCSWGFTWFNEEKSTRQHFVPTWCIASHTADSSPDLFISEHLKYVQGCRWIHKYVWTICSINSFEACILGCFRKKHCVSRNNWRNPSHICLEVILKESKRIFDPDKVERYFSPFWALLPFH